MAADCVLIVDDDADIRETLGLLLESRGYRTAAAVDGAQALDQLRKSASPPALILLDLMMPGMNGVQFRAAQMADPALASIPVVVLSGDSNAIHKTMSMGVDLLPKPLDVDALLGLIERFCKTGSEADGP